MTTTAAEQLIARLKERKDAENLADRRRRYFAENNARAAEQKQTTKRSPARRTRKTRDAATD